MKRSYYRERCLALEGGISTEEWGKVRYMKDRTISIKFSFPVLKHPFFLHSLLTGVLIYPDIPCWYSLFLYLGIRNSPHHRHLLPFSSLLCLGM